MTVAVLDGLPECDLSMPLLGPGATSVGFTGGALRASYTVTLSSIVACKKVAIPHARIQYDSILELPRNSVTDRCIYLCTVSHSRAIRVVSSLLQYLHVKRSIVAPIRGVSTAAVLLLLYATMTRLRLLVGDEKNPKM